VLPGGLAVEITGLNRTPTLAGIAAGCGVGAAATAAAIGPGTSSSISGTNTKLYNSIIDLECMYTDLQHEN
jgi:hypothetical protein